jgi:multidrug efflux pump subunit AcrA (membrane-fusion protein)
MIPEGTQVEQGEVIARFDTTVLDDRLREHRADLETTMQEREKEERNLDVSLKQLRLDLVKAEGELKKLEIEMAVPEELISTFELQQMKFERELAQRRVDFLREKIEFSKELVASKLELLDVKREFSEGKIAYNEETRAKFEVKAPVSGMVVYIPKQNGDRWEVGEGVWMLAKILKVADVSTLQVEAAVLEVDSAKIAVGQPAEISIDALPNLKLSSGISEIGRLVHERSVQDPSKVFDAIMPLDGIRHEDLRPGMGVQVRIETKSLPEQLTIPLNAVRLSEEGAYVEVVGADGPQRRVIVLGDRNSDRVVVESGLEEGETVLLAPAAGAA